MTLAIQDDVRAALRRDLTEDEQVGLDDLLAEASDLVRGYLHPYQIPTQTPPAISRVVAAMAAAVLIRPANLLPETQSLNADAYGITFAAGSTSPGPYLTAALKERLRPYKQDLVSIELSSENT